MSSLLYASGDLVFNIAIQHSWSVYCIFLSGSMIALFLNLLINHQTCWSVSGCVQASNLVWEVDIHMLKELKNYFLTWSKITMRCTHLQIIPYGKSFVLLWFIICHWFPWSRKFPVVGTSWLKTSWNCPNICLGHFVRV